MNFVPEQKEAVAVPFYDDVSADAGWKGQATSKSVERLESEVMQSFSRLGGLVVNFQRGIFLTGEKRRDGYQIHYALDTPDGAVVPGRMAIAALPVKTDHRAKKTEDKRKEKSLKMALFMLRDALDGQWFLQQLSPGYAPLMPWMLTDEGETVTQLWSEGSAMKNLLPPDEFSEFIDGDFIITDERSK